MTYEFCSVFSRSFLCPQSTSHTFCSPLSQATDPDPPSTPLLASRATPLLPARINHGLHIVSPPRWRYQFGSRLRATETGPLLESSAPSEQGPKATPPAAVTVPPNIICLYCRLPRCELPPLTTISPSPVVPFPFTSSIPLQYQLDGRSDVCVLLLGGPKLVVLRVLEKPSAIQQRALLPIITGRDVTAQPVDTSVREYVSFSRQLN